LEAHLCHDGIFGLFEQTVEPPQDEHRQDHVAVLAAHVDIAQAVVGDGPDEGDKLVVNGQIHGLVSRVM
jgi:hypothetical protein